MTNRSILSQKSVKLFGVFILVACIYAAYGPMLQHEFNNYDDELYITKNPLVLSGVTLEGMLLAFKDTHVGHWHPLTFWSHVLDILLYGLNPGGHLLTNLLLHIFNTLLLLLVLTRMTGAFWRSYWVACLFALHPLHVESVAWVAERKDVLSTFFFMLTLWAYIHYARSPSISTYVPVVVLFALGLMSKSMLVTLPFVMFLIDWWPLGRVGRRTGHSLEAQPTSLQGINGGSVRMSLLILEKTPLLVLSAATSVMAYFAAKNAGAVISSDVYPLSVRLANAVVSYVTYLRKMFWPTDLAVFYPHPGVQSLWKVAVCFLLVLSVTSLAIHQARSRPYLIVGWLWYLGTLVPVIGVVQAGAQGMADRYTYIPLVGIFILLTWGVSQAVQTWPNKDRVWLPAIAVLLLVLGLATREQVGYWRNSATLYEHALSVTKGNYFAHNNLGSFLYTQGKLEESIPHFMEAKRINPDYAYPYYNIGLVRITQGDYKAGIPYVVKALKLNPNLYQAYSLLADIYLRRGELQRAIGVCRTGLGRFPKSPDLHFWLGLSHVHLRDRKAALTEYQYLEKVKPPFARKLLDEMHKERFHGGTPGGTTEGEGETPDG